MARRLSVGKGTFLLLFPTRRLAAPILFAVLHTILLTTIHSDGLFKKVSASR